jgi:hypothetical protein
MFSFLKRWNKVCEVVKPVYRQRLLGTVHDFLFDSDVLI